MKIIQLALILLMLLPGAVVAMGIGVNLGYAKEDWGSDSSEAPREAVSLAPLTLDTSVSEARKVNYKFSFGAEINNYEKYYVNYQGYMMTHTLGFPLFTDSRIKIWLGPDFKFVYYTKFKDDYYSKEEDRVVVLDEGKGEVIGVGGGIRLGINILLARRFALALDVGNRYMRYHGSYTMNHYPQSKEEVKGDVLSTFVGFGVIFMFRE